ncbi:transcription termination/antitermination NusG family protein, partial [Acinetobacter baumannii]
TERRFFPGYVLVEMEMTDETWHLVKNTATVTGFIGGKSHRPTPLPQREVDSLLRQMQEGVEKPRPKVLYEVGEMVRIKEGP